MATLRSEPVKVVEYTQRPVPLSHAYYAPEVGVTDLAGLNDHYSRAFARRLLMGLGV